MSKYFYISGIIIVLLQQYQTGHQTLAQDLGAPSDLLLVLVLGEGAGFLVCGPLCALAGIAGGGIGGTFGGDLIGDDVGRFLFDPRTQISGKSPVYYVASWVLQP